MRAHRSKGDRGFALLIVLFLLALAGFSILALCRMSVETALAAKTAEEDLQLEWGGRSVRRIVLQNGPLILRRRFERALERFRENDLRLDLSSPESSLRSVVSTVTLGGVEFSLRFEDEQAKLNVNSLSRDLGRREAQRVVADLFERGDFVARLRPLRTKGLEPGARPLAFPRYLSLEQVFEDFDPDRYFEGRSPRDRLTCFGDERLRLGVAEDRVLESLLGRVVRDRDKVARAVEVRRENPDLTIDQLLGFLPLNPRVRWTLRNRLTDRSGCYSLWLKSRSDVRSALSLTVFEPEKAEGRRGLYFLF